MEKTKEELYMTENELGSNYKEQKEIKPKIESILKFLPEDKQEIAFNFYSFLTELKLPPKWASMNSFNFNYRNKRVCYIRTGDNMDNLYLWIYTQYNKHFIEYFENKNMNDVIIKTMVLCHHCNICAPGKAFKLFGKEIKNVCSSPSQVVLRLQNPNKEELEYAKELVKFRRDSIKEERVPKHIYVKISERKK